MCGAVGIKDDLINGNESKEESDLARCPMTQFDAEQEII